MLKALIVGGSVGLFVGVLIGTVGGTSMLVEVIMQMVFCTIGGLGVGVCFHVLTRKKGEDETFLPSSTDLAEPQTEKSNRLIWLIPLASVLAALVKGFMVGARLGQ